MRSAGLKVERVAVFGLDFPNIINQIMGLREGFRHLGIDVLAAWPHPNALVLENVLDSFQPDFVFEINRSRNQIPELDERFLHVCWMQDIQSLGERLDQDFGGSDLTYFIFPPSAMGYPRDLDEEVSYLLPATSPDLFEFRVEQSIFDFSFIGQMFAPISEALRNRAIEAQGRQCGTIGELLDFLELKGVRHSTHSIQETGVVLDEFVRRYNPDIDSSTIEPAIKNLSDEYFPRLTERRQLLDGALDISGKVGFFGTGPWHEWPRFHGHFGGYISRPSKMAEVFRRTKVNLHNGPCSMIARVLDCMATGGAIMVNRCRWDGTPFGIDRHFAAGRHFVEYDFDNFEQVARKTLEDSDRRRRIGADAAKTVRASHTWRHRAEQILSDVSAL